MSNEIATQQNTEVAQIPKPQIATGHRGLQPQTLDEMYRLAKAIASSAVVPKAMYNKPNDVFVAMQMGAEVGLSPMSSVQNIAVINGRPSIWGDSALAIVQSHPQYEYHSEGVEGSGENAVGWCTVKRKGSAEHTERFSVADAKKAQLWNKAGPWVNYPTRMLKLRARGFALRDKFSDALRGMITAEEAMDYPQSVGQFGPPPKTIASLTERLTQSVAPESPIDETIDVIPEQNEPESADTLDIEPTPAGGLFEQDDQPKDNSTAGLMRPHLEALAKCTTVSEMSACWEKASRTLPPPLVDEFKTHYDAHKSTLKKTTAK